MAKIDGTIPLSGVIAPLDSNDEYPVTEDIYNKGGHRSVPSILDRDNITALRRKEGMIVFVEADSINYQLVGGTWEVFAGSSGAGDKTYNHIQGVAETTWNVEHNLNKYPSVSVMDTGGNVVEGEIDYIDLNNIQLLFSAPFTGTASFN